MHYADAPEGYSALLGARGARPHPDAAGHPTVLTYYSGSTPCEYAVSAPQCRTRSPRTARQTRAHSGAARTDPCEYPVSTCKARRSTPCLRYPSQREYTRWRPRGATLRENATTGVVKYLTVRRTADEYPVSTQRAHDIKCHAAHTLLLGCRALPRTARRVRGTRGYSRSTLRAPCEYSTVPSQHKPYARVPHTAAHCPPRKSTLWVLSKYPKSTP